MSTLRQVSYAFDSTPELDRFICNAAPYESDAMLADLVLTCVTDFNTNNTRFDAFDAMVDQSLEADTQEYQKLFAEFEQAIQSFASKELLARYGLVTECGSYVLFNATGYVPPLSNRMPGKVIIEPLDDDTLKKLIELDK